MCEMVLTSLFCLQGVQAKGIPRAQAPIFIVPGGTKWGLVGVWEDCVLYYCNVLGLVMRLCL